MVRLPTRDGAESRAGPKPGGPNTPCWLHLWLPLYQLPDEGAARSHKGATLPTSKCYRRPLCPPVCEIGARRGPARPAVFALRAQDPQRQHREIVLEGCVAADERAQVPGAAMGEGVVDEVVDDHREPQAQGLLETFEVRPIVADVIERHREVH